MLYYILYHPVFHYVLATKSRKFQDDDNSRTWAVNISLTLVDGVQIQGPGYTRKHPPTPQCMEKVQPQFYSVLASAVN